MRVLQVEDDATTAQMVEQMLASKGYQCETTALGEEAVELATQNAYDLILLDIMLPDIDGYEVLRRLEAASVTTPVLVQSGLIGREEMEKGHGFGVDDYLVKPFPQAELIGRIDKLFSRANDNQDDRPTDPEDEFDRRDSQRDGGLRRRKHKRIKTLKSGDIVFGEAKTSVNCLILNLSGGGAALQLKTLLNLPETFELRIQNGPLHVCELCWRHGNKLGVRFLSD
ncbi:MAG: response regulator [Kiloniellales bacterium]